MKTKNQIDVSVKWMVRKDMPEVEAIEQSCFEFPWYEDDFIRCLRQRNCIGMVAEASERVVGFMVYELHKHRLHVLNFAVHEDWRFKGVGRAMLAKIVSKISNDRRSRIVLEVRETNVDAQLFFKRMGFKAVSVLRGFYLQDTDEDAYLFQYTYRQRMAP